MGFDDDGVLVGSIPGPVDFVPRDSLEVALLAMKTLCLDEEPNLAFLNIVELFGFVNVRRRMISRCPLRDHQTAFVAITFNRHHRTFSFSAGADAFSLWNIFAFYVKRHKFFLSSRLDIWMRNRIYFL